MPRMSFGENKVSLKKLISFDIDGIFTIYNFQVGWKISPKLILILHKNYN